MFQQTAKNRNKQKLTKRTKVYRKGHKGTETNKNVSKSWSLLAKLGQVQQKQNQTETDKTIHKQKTKNIKPEQNGHKQT